MSTSILPKIGLLIHEQRDVLLARWRRAVRLLPSAKNLSVPTLNDHVPELIVELADALQAQSEELIEDVLVAGSPPQHGRQRLNSGYDIEEVVAEYNALRNCVHDLAEENGVVIHGDDLRIVNRVLDEAIGLAVQTFATHLALELKQRREEHLSFVACDMQAPLRAVAFTSGALESSLSGDQNHPRIQQYFKVLRRNIRHLEGLLAKVIKENPVAAAQGAENAEPRAIDLWPLVEEVMQGFAPVASTASVELTNQVPDTAVTADAGMLTRVFHILIAHAIEQMPRGSIVVDAGESQGLIECRVNARSAKDTRDGAGGFDSGNSSREQADGSHSLTTARRLIQAQGGAMIAEFEDSVGMAFHFTLPAAEGPTSENSPSFAQSR